MTDVCPACRRAWGRCRHTRLFPDAELCALIVRQVELEIGASDWPELDREDCAEMFRMVYVHRWLSLYGRTLLQFGTHDHAVMMCANREMLRELAAEAHRAVDEMLSPRRNSPRRNPRTTSLRSGLGS